MTTNKQPSIEVTFKQLAATAVERGSKGRVGIILFDSTDTTFDTVTYKLSSEIEENKFTAENVKFLKDCFVGAPMEVTVIRVNSDGTVSDAINTVKTLKLDWIGSPSTVAAVQNDIASFVKESEANGKTYKAVVFNPTAMPDSKHVVRIANTKVVFADERGEKDSYAMIPSMLGVLAGLKLNRSATYLTMNNLKSVLEVSNIDDEISKGGLVLFNDEGEVKISTAVNSLTTVDANNTLMMTKIENIETMDMIYSDIVRTFKDGYVGKSKNSTDRQYLFIGAVNSYFKSLAMDELLDPNYPNKAFIDVVSQRIALKALKGDVVDTWSDELVINTPVGTKVFVSADIKLLESTENLTFAVKLF